MGRQHTQNRPFGNFFRRKLRDQSNSGLLLTITIKGSKGDLSLPEMRLEGLILLNIIIRRSPVPPVECKIRSWDATAALTIVKPWSSALSYHHSDGSTGPSLDVIRKDVFQDSYYSFFRVVSGPAPWWTISTFYWVQAYSCSQFPWGSGSSAQR